MKRALIVLGVLLLIPVVVLGAILVYLTTAPGLATIASLTSKYASSDDTRIAIGKIEGTFPTDMTIRDVRLSDRKGEWLTVDRVRVEWSPLQLYNRKLVVNLVDVGEVKVARQPDYPEQNEPVAPPDPNAPLFPELPIEIHLEKFTLAALDLAAPVMGVPAKLAATAAATLRRPAEGVSAEFDLRRIDDTPGQIAGHGRFVPATNGIELSLRGSEPAGGLVARMAQIPGLPPINIGMDGAGTLDALRTQLVITAGDQGRIDGAADVKREGKARRFTLGLTGDVGRMVSPGYAPLVEGATKISAEALAPDEGPIDLIDLSVEAPSARFSARGKIDASAETVDLSYDARAGEPARFAAVLPADVSWASLSLLGTAKGPLDHPVIDATIDGGGLAAEQGGAETARIALKATPDGALSSDRTRVAIVVDAKADGVKFADDRLFSLGRTFTMSAALNTTLAGDAQIERSEVRLADVVAATYAGAVSPDAAKGHATLKASDLSTLSPLAGRTLAGAVDVASDIDVAFDLSRLGAAVNGTASGLKTGVAQVDALTGGALMIKGGVTRSPDGSFAFQGFDARGDHVVVTADGSATRERADVRAKAEVDDLSLVDQRAAGKATMDATLTGRLDDLGVKAVIQIPDGRAMDRSLKDVRLDLDATDVTGAVGGTFRLAGLLGGKPLRGTGGLSTDDSGARHLTALDLQIASTSVKGDLLVTPAALATGKLSVDAPDLSDVGAIALMELAGTLKGDVDLSVEGGVQRAAIGATGQNIVAPGAKIGAIDVAATVIDPTGKLTLDGTAHGSSIAVGGQVIDKAAVVAKGAPDGMDVSLDMSARGSSAVAQGRVVYAPAETRIDLSKLDIAGGGKTARLASPARVRVVGSDVAIDVFSLRASDGGLLTVKGKAGAQLDLDIALRELPLALGNAFTPDLGLGGVVEGDAKVTGPSSAPQATFDVRGTDLSIAQLRDAKVPPLTLATKGRLEGDRIVTDTTVTGAGGLSLSAQGSAPMGDGDLDMTVAMRSVPLALANVFRPDLKLAGSLQGDAKIAGPVSAPRGTYDVRIAGLASGQAKGVPVLSIAAKGALEGQRVTTDAALTGAGGVSLVAKGAVPLGRGDVDMVVTIRELPLAIANAAQPELGLKGALRGDVRVSGPIDAPRGTYDLKITELEAAAARGLPPLSVAARGALEGTRVTTLTTVAGGGIDLAAQGAAPLGDGPLDINVAIRALPLNLANAFAPDVDIDGVLRGTAHVAGTAKSPVAAYDLAVSGLTSSRARGVAPLGVVAKGTADAKRVATDAVLSGGGGVQASVKGSAPLGEGDLDMAVSIRELPLAIANGVRPELGLGGVLRGDVKLGGPVKRPVGTYDLQIANLVAAEAKGAPPLQVATKGELQGDRVTTDTTVTGQGGVNLVARGSAPLGDGDLDMAVTIRQLPLSLANGFRPELGLSGVLTGDAKVTGPVKAPRGTYDLKIADLLATPARGVPALQVATSGTLEGERVTTDTTVSGGGGIELTAKGSAPLGDGDLDMTVAIRQLPLAIANAFRPELGLTGTLKGDAKVAGPVKAPTGTYDLTVTGLTSAQAKGVPALEIAAKGDLQGERVTTDTVVTGGGGLSLTAKGAAPINGTGAVDMAVTLRDVPLSLANAFQPALGLGGKLKGAAKVGGTIAAPLGTYDLSIADLTAAQAKGVPALQIATKGTLEGQKVTTDTAITGGGGVRAVARGAIPITAAGGDVDLTVDIAELPLAIANGFVPSLGLGGKLAGGARIGGSFSAPAGTYDFRVANLTAAQAKGVPPIQISAKGDLAGGRVTTDTAVTGGGGLRITANGSAPVGATGDLDMTIAIRSVPLALANGFSPGLGANGTLQGDARVGGPVSAPTGTYSLKVTGLSTAATRSAGVPAAAIDSKGRLEGRRVSTDTVVTAASGLRVTARGSAPLGAGDLDLAVAGRAPLAFLNDTLSVSGDRVDGTATFDVKVGGPTSAPRINGTGSLANGSYFNRAAGLQLKGMTASVAANGATIDVRSLKATTRNGGSISGSGRVEVDPAAGFPGQIAFKASNAEIVGTDIVTAITDADLRLEGPLARRPVVRGTISTRSVEIQIPDRIPARYTPLPDVRHRGAPAAVMKQYTAVNTGKAKGKKDDAFVATLDISVEANDRIFIRGLGMQAEAGGKITVGGTSVDPEVVGAFNLRQGRSQITVIGHKLDFTRGAVSFAGDLDPTLDFVAETKAKDITAQVLITGTASAPQIAFGSNPSVPTDEVLSRLLFNKASGELSASQALQLAQAVAQYSGVGGGGGGPLESLRKGLGVDSLDLGAGESGGFGLGVGRYIADNIYLGFTSGTTPQDTGVTVNIDLTDHIKARGQAGAAGNTSAGVAAEWDY
ncbi:translocation/assembly module TamB domain-containing protein [Hansschlegelia plantiphila]|nr:translocation/assembly module TamB domain-containing protein [Hansschlegelia plantiphila]